MWARDMVNRPSKEKPPAVFASEARKLLRGTGVTVEVLDVAQLKAKKLGGVLGVGQGSDQTPALPEAHVRAGGRQGQAARVRRQGRRLRLRWPVARRRARGMETMKSDMSGAAAVDGRDVGAAASSA